MSTPLPVMLAENYAELREKLSDLPATWYPDLIRTMIEAAIAKKVFKPGGATIFVAQMDPPPPWEHSTK